MTGLKDVTARTGEIIMATGSIGDMNGPWIFIGNDEIAGGYRPVSKIYQGTTAPTITVGSHGSTIDGTPFYSTTAQTLFILNKDGNVAMDLTGNIEGNIISAVTINTVSGTTANYQNISGSFTGSGAGLYDIPANGIVGLNLSHIADGPATASISSVNGFNVNTNSTINGTLTVTGNTFTKSDVYITGNTFQTGSINITGDVVLKGNISIGDSLTGDTVSLNGEISSSLIPSDNNIFNLGSLQNQWNKLYVDEAFINTINISGISTTNLELPGYLTVSGQTTLSGSVYVEDLTDNRVTIAGPNGLLEDSADLTFNGTSLNVGQGKMLVDVSDGDIRTSGSLSVGSTADVSGALTVNGATDLKSTLNVTGATQMYSTLNVDGESTLSSAVVEDLTDNRIVIVGVGGALEDDVNFTFNGTELNIGQGKFKVQQSSGNVTTEGSLIVTGTTNLYNTLVVSSGTTLNDTLRVINNTSLEGTLTVTGATDMKSTLVVSGATTIDDTLRVTGNSSLEGTLTVTGATDMKSTLVVSGATTIDDTLRVTGNSSLEGTLTVTGSTALNGGLTLNGNETVNGILTVTGNTQLGGNLYVSGNLEVLGSATSVNIQSTNVEIGDNIILVNAYSPYMRYAGLTGYDSGSAGASGSLLWDSLNDYWLFQNSNATTSRIVGVSGGTMGSEASLTSNFIPVAMGPSTLKDSLIGENGTTLSYNTNKFTVTASNGNTLIAGNVTLSAAGGSDNNSKTSAIVFKNSSNVLGYVSTTETTDVMDGILGYKNSNGALVFSTVIDGGTF